MGARVVNDTVIGRFANRNKYLEALKEYREEENPGGLVALFEKEQYFYLEKCKYFM